MSDKTKLRELFDRLPKYSYVCQKCLWSGDMHVDINHYDNDLDKPLDYEEAILKMLRKIEEKTKAVEMARLEIE